MATVPAEREGHIVLLANGPWADGKQLCIFATRLVKLRPIHVTVFTNAFFLERAKREVSSELAGVGAVGHVRVIALPSDKHKHFVDPVFDAAFAQVYRQLLSGEPVQCTTTGEQLGPLPLPQAIVTPNSTLESLQRLRKETGADVKLLIWYARVPSTLFFFHGPANRGGLGDVRAKVRAEAERRRTSPEEVFEETILFLDSVLIRIPGYEPLYNHEVQPQELAYHGTLGAEWLTIYDMFTSCDGVLMSTPECFDPLSIIGTRAWMGETARGAYAVGPLLSTGARAVENELMDADRGTEIRDFVSRVMKSHGPQSLLYISLGSWMWPKYPEKLWTFLDVVMDLGIPFILSHASEYAEIPDTMRHKVDHYPLGLLSSWCPQQMILNHPVTAWFLTHCGHNSVMESISAGVPMICWPFVGDGALNAIHLADTLKCAYELLEVRTGHGLERIYRTGARALGTRDALRAEALQVLASAFGEDGARKRANVRKMQARFDGVWAGEGGGGESVRATEAFLRDLGL
ncbi:UDP-glycosyltransferase 84A1 [Trametes pubescens]|uniref:UDP-glycosyltransferase 84A1 n=1 Tax=Trametes pubescens TaxID=154538 RepID=A0A1M2VMJ2_TRAPU|nr:UDP-glycosyltransferase 84A1 [Trametes pubescens]